MALDKKSYIIPSVLLAEAYYSRKDDEKFIISKVEHVIQDGFFKSLELLPITDAKLRKKVASALKTKGCNISSCVVWTNESLCKAAANINDLDETKRKKAVDAIKSIVDGAYETGATHIGISAGPNVGILERSSAYKALIKSIGEIADYTNKNNLTVLLEPSDCFKHNKNLLTSTYDARELLEIISKEYSNVKLSLNTAHVSLNREDLCEAMDLAAPFIERVHLSNAILDLHNPLYGSHRILPDLPGFLTAKVAEQIFSHAYKANINKDTGIKAAVELRQDNINLKDRAFEFSTDFLKQIMLEFYLSNK